MGFGLEVWGKIEGRGRAGLDWWGIFGACHRVLKKPRTKNITMVGVIRPRRRIFTKTSTC